VLYNKKAEGEVTRLAIAGIIVAMFSAGLIGLAVDMDRNYDLDFDESEFETFQRISSFDSNVSLEILSNVEEGSGEISPEGDLIEAQARAGFKSSKILLEIPFILKDLVIDSFTMVSQRIGIPSAFMFGLLAIITITVAASAMALIFKRSP